MPNKDIEALLRKCRKQGARIRQRKSGPYEVHTEHGFEIVHQTLSNGSTIDLTRKKLRKLGLKV